MPDHHRESRSCFRKKGSTACPHHCKIIPHAHPQRAASDIGLLFALMAERWQAHPGHARSPVVPPVGQSGDDAPEVVVQGEELHLTRAVKEDVGVSFCRSKQPRRSAGSCLHVSFGL